MSYVLFLTNLNLVYKKEMFLNVEMLLINMNKLVKVQGMKLQNMLIQVFSVKTSTKIHPRNNIFLPSFNLNKQNQNMNK